MNQPFGAIVIKVNMILINRSGEARLRCNSSSGLPISQREDSILTWIHSLKEKGSVAGDAQWWRAYVACRRSRAQYPALKKGESDN